MGPQTVLEPSKELRIKKWILDRAQFGFPMHTEELQNAVQKVEQETGRANPFVNNRPGKKWMQLFLKRHPEIVLKRTEMFSKARAAVTKKKIREWVSEAKEYLTKEEALDILKDPSRMYNLDETGVQTCPKTGKVLCLKGEKNNYSIASKQEKQCITMLCCYAASGQVVDPMVVYPNKGLLGI
ncbi:uncharacterized protein LOC117181289 [Belonocnema kinseyi]|uniref:uncharacterized protein LOC117181289 n=1 Tax=Belonocnema kinseyi TaxID=2817044 RepID=UPI00143D3544|nr:uncharacterized protein LOC117181289 [Belonocnema kinseyi]